MILKGQNLRLLVRNSDKATVVAMSTNLTVNLTGNTEEASTKDDTGNASRPAVVSKGWSAQVESLDVTDAAAMLTAIQTGTPFTLIWDETATGGFNHSGAGASFSRTGQAYINDITFAFNNRANSTKSIQFTGTGELTTTGTVPEYGEPTASALTKGQFVRLFLGSDNTAVPSAVIASAQNLSFHVSCTLENSSTKDTEGDWIINEVTGVAFDISTTALVRCSETIRSSVAGRSLSELESIYEASSPVRFAIANVSGDNQRTKGAVIVSGSVIVTSLSIQAANRSNAEYSAGLTGYGPFSVGA